MSCVRLLLASAATVALGSPLGAQATRPPQRCEGADAPLSVRVDSAKREVVILVGPCIVHPMDMSGMEGMAGMAGMDMSKMSEMGEYSGKVDVRTGFVWPASMYMRGWDLTVLDSLGRRLPQNTMHHMELVNFDRRQLVYPMAERVLGIGEETGPALIPKSVGMPLTKGTHMGLYVMWNNTTDTDMRGIYMQVRMKYSPMNMTPKPVVVLPFKVDVNLHPGMGDAFDVKDGHGSRAATFTVPIAGRLIAIGGHLHDYGKELRLEDVATGKVIARVRASGARTGRSPTWSTSCSASGRAVRTSCRGGHTGSSRCMTTPRAKR